MVVSMIQGFKRFSELANSTPDDLILVVIEKTNGELEHFRCKAKDLSLDHDGIILIDGQWKIPNSPDWIGSGDTFLFPLRNVFSISTQKKS